MDIKEEQKQIIPTSIQNPRLFIAIGFFAGVLIWIIDAAIDVYILKEYNSFIDGLILIEGKELWMRILIMLLFTAVGLYASVTFKKSLDLNVLLYKYQFELEDLVTSRTKELEEKTDMLEGLANIDPLTGRYNRRKFLEVAENELSRFKRHGETFSLCMIDIDNFKSINDKYGHDVGDYVIKTVADIITTEIRGTDCFARWGGEEYIILLPATDIEGSEKLSEKIVNIISDYEFDKVKKVTISLGVTTVGSETDNIDEIIKRADEGLYSAKDGGKNQYHRLT